MFNLYATILKSTLKKKETLLFFMFALFPTIILVVNLFDTNFMQLSAPNNSLSFIEFFGAVMTVQHQLVLPLIILIYLVSTMFYSEIKQGILFLYKDINKNKLLNAKLFSVISIYFIYILILFVSSLATYYLYLVKLPYTSGLFFTNIAIDFYSSILEIVGVIFIANLCILVSSLLSINFSSGITMLVSILFLLVCSLAPNLKSIRYVFPNGYLHLIDNLSFSTILPIILLLFLIYSAILYVITSIQFKKVEY